MSRARPPQLALILACGLVGWALLSPAAGYANVADKLREGCRLLTGGRWQAAGQAFHEALGQDAQCAAAQAGEATALLLGGYEEAADAAFESALALDSQLAAAHAGRGAVAYLRGNHAAAWTHYQRALGADPAHPGSLRTSAALVACTLGQYETADTLSQMALRESPDQELALQVQAAALLARGKAADTLAVLSRPTPTGMEHEPGIAAGSPLFSSSSRYYQDHGLAELAQQLTTGARPPATAGGAPVAGAPGLPLFTRGDNLFRIEWPRPGAAVKGRIELSIYAAPEANVQYVAVLIDEQFAGMSNATPYRIVFDSALARDGLREIRVDGYGPDGTIAHSAAVVVNVSNAQRTLTPEEQTVRAGVADFLETYVVLRADPLLRAQLVGHALEALGRVNEAVDAYEYAFSYEPTMPGVRTDLLLAYRRLGLAAAVTSHELHSLPRTNAVALTFDDGPHPVLTPWILDLLDRYQAKATFFLVGRQVEMYPELTREIVRRGHQIGSHSYTHSNLRQISGLGVERELVMSRLMMRRACGEFITTFRPPGGNYDPQVREAVAATNYTAVFWTENITSYPGWSGPDILPRMLSRIGDSGIVLLHNGYDETREVLPLLLPVLAQRGLRMDTVGALTGQAPFRLPASVLYPPDWKL